MDNPNPTPKLSGLDQFLAPLLNPLLNRIPTGWKTAIGLVCLLTLAVLQSLGKLTPEQSETYQLWIMVLFGIGVYHKVTR